MLPNAASFLVTEDCNLACKYCFELCGRNKGSMSKEIVRRSLDYLSDNAIKEGMNEFNAMIFGGEPFLKPDIVEEILSYGIELSKIKNITFTSSLVTNATILTPKIKRIISTYKDEANLNIQLSVDGIKEVHDAYRVTKNGRGTFDIIEKNIPEWKELFKDNIHALSLHGCSNKETLPYLFENYKYFREVFDIPRIWFMPIHSEEWDDGDVIIYEEQLTKIADYILGRVKKEGNYQEVVNYAPIDKCLNRDIRPNAPCGAGKNFVSITANGEIYPCHHFYFNDPEKTTLIGNIWNGIDDDKRRIFLNYGNEDMSCTKEMPDCECYQCYRCIADNWCSTGSILSQIRGARCAMSFIERKIQLRIRGELSRMGLMNYNQNNEVGNNSNNPACLCDLGTPRGCDVVVDCDGNIRGLNGNNQQVTNCQCKKETPEDSSEIIASALELILKKLDIIETEQSLILKKLL